ncbi:MAG TPA: VWA domain-containing protein [Vicinamibacterales bacterium]|nr:VWA domain-containing protein [Vicinamibacterales bacterium]
MQIHAGMWQVAGIVVVPVLLASAVAAQQPPTFRSRVDLITVDATVLDREGRPLRGLGPDDFRLQVDGEPRKIVSVQYVSYDVPAAETPAAGQPQPVVHLDSRVLVIAVDQGNIRRVEGGAALRAGAAFIDTLASSDRIAAVSVDSTEAIEFTTDHARVKRTLGGLLGRAVSMPTEFPVGLAEALGIADGSRGWLDRVVTRVCGQPLARVQRMERMALEEGMRDPCPTHVEQQARAFAHNARSQGEQSVDAIKRLLRRLDDIEGPKTLVLLSEGLVAEPRLVDMTEVSVLAQQARTTIYVLQVDVPIVEAGDDFISPTTADDVRVRGDGLARLAGAAGGALLQLVGSDPSPFRRILRETSGHYLLAFEPAPRDRDGATHRIAVSVRRDGATVRARPAFTVPPPPTVATTVEDQLVQLLRSRRMATALPLRLGVTSARGQGDALNVHVDVELDGPQPDATYGAVVVDAKGLVVTSATSRTTTGRFSFGAAVAPGRYLFRVAAVEPGGQSGTVERTVDVQLQGETIRASDLVLTTRGSGVDAAAVIDRTDAASMNASFEIYAPREWTPGALALELVSSGSTPALRHPCEVRWVEAGAHWAGYCRVDLASAATGRYVATVTIPGGPVLTRTLFVTQKR